MKSIFKILLLNFLILIQIGTAFSQNLSVKGSIYTIDEPDMLDMIYKKLVQMQENGELDATNRAILNRTKKGISRPDPVSGIDDLRGEEMAVTREFDPSIVLKKDIMNLDGKVIAKRGTKVNPLDYMDFNETLIFINSDNRDQLIWADRFIEKHTKNRTSGSTKKYKIILVKGNVVDTAKFLHRSVYFDQFGRLSHRFGIRRVPTIIYQPRFKNTRLKVLMVKEVQVD